MGDKRIQIRYFDQNSLYLFVGVLISIISIGCSPSLITRDWGAGTTSTSSTSEADLDILLVGRSTFGLYDKVSLGAEPSANGVELPNYVEKVGTQWIVSDMNRVLIFNGSLGAANPVVIGQTSPDVIVPNSAVSATSSRGYYQFAVSGGKLIVTDCLGNRVLIWNSIPTQNNQAADVVIGQSDFVSQSANQGNVNPAANTLSCPFGVTVIGGKLIIADSSNSRLVVFNSIPTSNNASANYAIGQSNLVTGSANQGGAAAANTLQYPGYLSTDGTKLVVADYYNNRVLIYNSLPASNVNADVIIGQTTASGTSTGTSATQLKYPYHALIAGGHLYIADTMNHRILYYAAVPASGMGASATAQIGQPDFTTATNAGTGMATQTNMTYPYALAYDGSDLYVAENFKRILKYSGLPTPADSTAGASTAPVSLWGQSRWVDDSSFAGVPSNSNFRSVDSICQNSAYLVACDNVIHRCLVFDKTKIKSGAISVVGQPDFTSQGANHRSGGPLADGLNLWYSGCEIDSQGRLFIADGGNNRVLVWNQIPTSSGTSADQVLGQVNFTSNSTGCTSSTMQTPTMMKAVGNYLYVGTWYNYRALIFDISGSAGSAIPSAAIGVVGQPNFTTCTSGTTASKTSRVLGMAYDGSRFYLNDGFNRRVLIYNSLPTGIGQSADAVIGQSNLTTTAGIGTTISAFGNSTDRNYLLHTNFGVIDNFLWIPDVGNHRFLGWDVSGTITNGMNASYVIGQSDFTSGTALYPFGNASATDFVHTYFPNSIIEDTSGSYVWIGFNTTIVRMKKSVFRTHFAH